MVRLHQSLPALLCRQFFLFVGAIVLLGITAGCANNQAENARDTAQPAAHRAEEHQAETASVPNNNRGNDVLPAFTPVTLAIGEKLKVVASTNLVADIVAQVGGDRIVLHSLIGPAVDPHSYTVTPQDLRILEAAHVVFINGLHLEAALADLFTDLAAPLVPVNVGVATHELTQEQHDEAEAAHADEAGHEDEHSEETDADHHHEGIDPHTWQNVANVKVWVKNVEASLSELDPANAAAYATAATAYMAQLDALDAQIREKVAAIPPANRKLVTDHETFGYFADAYGFTVIGALVPSLSTMAEPSAQALATLQDQIAREGVKVIFVGTTVSPRLAEQLAQDLGIQVVSLYSDSLSAPDGPAATYLDFMRYNVDAIVEALQ